MIRTLRFAAVMAALAIVIAPGVSDAAARSLAQPPHVTANTSAQSLYYVTVPHGTSHRSIRHVPGYLRANKKALGELGQW